MCDCENIRCYDFIGAAATMTRHTIFHFPELSADSKRPRYDIMVMDEFAGTYVESKLFPSESLKYL